MLLYTLIKNSLKVIRMLVKDILKVFYDYVLLLMILLLLLLLLFTIWLIILCNFWKMYMGFANTKYLLC